MAKKVTNIQVKDTLIRTMQQNGMDYVCITDIARQKNAEEPKDVVKNWMRLKNTIEYMGLWEKLNNPQFKGVGFDLFAFNIVSIGLLTQFSIERIYNNLAKIVTRIL